MDLDYKNLIKKAVDKTSPSVISLEKSPGIKSDFDLIEEYSDRIEPSTIESSGQPIATNARTCQVHICCIVDLSGIRLRCWQSGSQ